MTLSSCLSVPKTRWNHFSDITQNKVGLIRKKRRLPSLNLNQIEDDLLPSSLKSSSATCSRTVPMLSLFGTPN